MKGHNAVTVALLLALVAAGGRTAVAVHLRVPEHNMAAAPPAVFYDLPIGGRRHDHAAAAPNTRRQCVSLQHQHDRLIGSFGHLEASLACQQCMPLLVEMLHDDGQCQPTMPTRRLDLVLFFGNKWSQMVSNPR